MRRIAIINQKGGVGKTTTTANLGAALAEQGRRVVLVDMDAQANLSLSLGVEAESGSATSYSVLTGESTFAAAVRATAMERVSLVASHIDLSGAELELAGQIGREFLLRDALQTWESEARAASGRAPADYVLFDCPPSLGLLSINALAAAGEVLITLQTEFLALQGMSKLVEVVQLLRKRLNPELTITGILPCLYESRLRLAREVLGEIRRYFPRDVFPVPIRANVKLAEAPSYGQTIFQYAPDSIGAMDYRCAAREVLRAEKRDRDTASLPPFREDVLAGAAHKDVAPRTIVAANATVERATTAAPAAHVAQAKHANAEPRALAESRARAAKAKHADAEPVTIAQPAAGIATAKHTDAPPSGHAAPGAHVAKGKQALAAPSAPPVAAAASDKRVDDPAPEVAPRSTRTRSKPSADSGRRASDATATRAESPRPATSAPSDTLTPAPKPPAKPRASAPVTPPVPANERARVATKVPDAPPAPPVAPAKPQQQPATTPTPRNPSAAPRASAKELAPRARSLPRVAARATPPATKPPAAKAPVAKPPAPTPPLAKSPAARPPAANPPVAKPVAKSRATPEPPSIVRADDLPPLPPDAFEILSGIDP